MKKLQNSSLDTASENMISVVVVARNEENKIFNCIKSIATQSLSSSLYEIILVDDGSTDKTIERALEAYENLSIIKNPCRSISKNRNLGWRSARGQYIAYLDADCVAPKSWLEQLYKTIIENDCEAAGGGNIPPKNKSYAYDCLSIMLDTFVGSRGSVQGKVFDSIREVRHLPGLNVMFKREILEKVGGYDERFARVGEDEDISIRIKQCGGRLIFTPSATVQHHQRHKISSWAKNMFTYGKGRTWLVRRHPNSFSFLFFLPIISVILLPLYIPLIALYSFYAVLRRRSPRNFIGLFSYYTVTHIPYGVGLIYGLFSRADTEEGKRRENRVFLITLKNAGNIGDEAILATVVSQLKKSSAKLTIYIMGVGPSGMDIRYLSDFSDTNRDIIHDLLRPNTNSRTTNFQSFITLARVIPILFSRSCFTISGGQWFHDLSLTKHVLICSMFAFFRATNNRTGLFCIGAGPLNSRVSNSLLHMAFGKKSFLSFRDQKSEKLFNSAGFHRTRLYTDPAFNLTTTKTHHEHLDKKEKIIGVCPCAWTTFEKIYLDDLRLREETKKQFIEIISHAIDRQFKVVFIPTMNPEDYEFSREIKQSLPTGLASHVECVDTSGFFPGQVQSLIKSLDILITMRLHPMIFAVNVDTPFIALNYAEKVSQLFKKIRANGSLVELDGSSWGKHVIDILNNTSSQIDTGSNIKNFGGKEGEILKTAYQDFKEWLEKSSFQN